MLGGGLVKQLTNLIWPPTCYGCGQVGINWCFHCQQKLTQNWYWQPLPVFRNSHLTIFFCTKYYQAPIYQLINLTKYQRFRQSGLILANSFASFIQVTIAHYNWFQESAISFVPLARSRQGWRGFNQAEQLAQAVAELNQRPLIGSWSRQSRTNQVRLGRLDRLNNLQGSITWTKPQVLNNFSRVIVIDDVVTSGATLIATTQALVQAGAKQVVGLVLAH